MLLSGYYILTNLKHNTQATTPGETVQTIELTNVNVFTISACERTKFDGSISCL